jgi:2-polyprenyl-6-hydroxyphenyl methylase/3-demethylubiquinone-9 3-methyltransferase
VTEPTFPFGKNWQEFLRRFDQERLRVAAESLIGFLPLHDLRGKTFLDVGCGSGLFSYAAYTLGAERIVSFDADSDSVACCKVLRAQAGDPDSWEVAQGSVLDREFTSRLGTFDLVYAWGVLHHTGRMWDSIRISTDLVSPGGYYYIALYNKILSRDGRAAWVHDFWTSVKRLYNEHPALGLYVLEPLAMAAYLGLVLLRGENPVAHVRNYKSQRGMSWSTDATDWLGGYPYEFATVEEVFSFVRQARRDFNLVNLRVTSGRGLNWYLFERTEIPSS